jgi:riboflavin kinase/FMN adenylyltransferase
MQVLHSIEQLSDIPGPVALAIGVFDGLHLGHQEVIRAANDHAHGHHGSVVVMTFDPHPLHILRPGSAPRMLCSARHQERILQDLGVQTLLRYPFTMETAQTEAQVFVKRLVNASKPLGCISVGHGWSFGRGREGNIHLLTDLGEKHDFAVYGIPPVRMDGEVVSSTVIREAVTRGDLLKAARLLGRGYAVMGRVVDGRKLGRQLGFPTANVEVENEQVPPLGVYAVHARLDDAWLPAVANLGKRPTVTENAEPTLEVHLLDWSGNCYAKEMEVRFHTHLREEKSFDGLEKLKAQIQRDIEAAKQLISQ